MPTLQELEEMFMEGIKNIEILKGDKPTKSASKRLRILLGTIKRETAGIRRALIESDKTI